MKQDDRLQKNRYDHLAAQGTLSILYRKIKN